MKSPAKIKTEHEARIAMIEMLPSPTLIGLLGACYSATSFMLEPLAGKTLIIDEHLLMMVVLTFVVKAPLIVLATQVWYCLFYFFQGTSGREILWWTILMCIVTNVSSLLQLVDVSRYQNLLGG